MVSKHDHHPTEIAGLFGKRLAVATETAEGGRLNEALAKELTGSDMLTARRMREDFWQFRPTHKLLLITNHKPKLTGRDNAIRRRLRLIPFTRRFTDAEQDKTLPDKLRAEAPGILAWLVRGCLDWQRHGLPAPAQVTDATADYITGEDVLGAWLAECCVTDDKGDTERAAALYSDYKSWCERTGERHVMNCRGLSAALTDCGFERYRNNGSCFRGIRLRQAGEPPTD
jgi:putative DNA primase/helicase